MKTRLVLFALAAAMAGCLASAAAFQADPRSDGEEALKARDWARAEKLLTQALGAAKEGQDELLVTRCRHRFEIPGSGTHEPTRRT